MTATCNNRTQTPCTTAFCAGAFRAALAAILADTALAVSAFLLLCLCLLNLQVLVNVGIFVLALVLIVRGILIPAVRPRRKRFVC